jgi:hypothetical protein
VTSTAAPSHALGAIEDTIDAEIDRVAAEGPTAAELERSLAQSEAHFIFRLQSVGDSAASRIS